MKLLQYQVEGVQFLTENKSALLNDEQGLGKTVQAVTAAATIQGPKLVICNSVSRVQWKDEIHKWDSPTMPVKFTGKAGLFDREAVQSWFKPPLTNAYLITYHPLLMYSWKELQRVGTWQIIIADEGHKYRNRTTARTKALKRLRTVRRWTLTATTFDKSPAELWSILNWLAPKSFKKYWPFVEDHIEIEEKWVGRPRPILKPTVLKDPKSFAKLISPYVLGRKKSKVASQLPPKLYKDITLPMSKYQRDLYERIREETIITLQDGNLNNALFIRNALSRMGKLVRCALDPGLIDQNHALENPKVDWLNEFKKSFDGQFVVFTGSKDFAKSLPTLINGGVCITGDDKLLVRDRKISKFKKGKAKYIVGTIQLVAESLDLPQASASIFTDLPLSGIMYSQAEDRIHRLTTKESPTIYRLHMENSIDFINLARLQGKLSDRQAVETLIGGYDA